MYIHPMTANASSKYQDAFHTNSKYQSGNYLKPKNTLTPDPNTEPDDDIKPIKRLASAMILRAVLDIRYELGGVSTLGGQGASEVLRSARVWLRSQEDSPPSFIWCCDILDIEPSVILNATLNLPDSVRLKLYYYTKGARGVNGTGKRVMKKLRTVF